MAINSRRFMMSSKPRITPYHISDERIVHHGKIDRSTSG